MLDDLSYFLSPEEVQAIIDDLYGESSKNRTSLQDFTPHELLTALCN